MSFLNRHSTRQNQFTGHWSTAALWLILAAFLPEEPTRVHSGKKDKLFQVQSYIRTLNCAFLHQGNKMIQALCSWTPQVKKMVIFFIVYIYIFVYVYIRKHTLICTRCVHAPVNVRAAPIIKAALCQHYRYFCTELHRRCGHNHTEWFPLRHCYNS